MAILPDTARPAAEVANTERRRLDETMARVVGQMCEGMLRAHRHDLRPPYVPAVTGGGAFLALNDSDVALLAATCQPAVKRSA